MGQAHFQLSDDDFVNEFLVVIADWSDNILCADFDRKQLTWNHNHLAVSGADKTQDERRLAQSEPYASMWGHLDGVTNTVNSRYTIFLSFFFSSIFNRERFLLTSEKSRKCFTVYCCFHYHSLHTKSYHILHLRRVYSLFSSLAHPIQSISLPRFAHSLLLPIQYKTFINPVQKSINL